MTRFFNFGGYGYGLYDADDVIVFSEDVLYYVRLLILQYINKPKARGLVGSLVNSVLADGLYKAVENAFDIETAVGVQLDVLALYVGAQRTVHGLDISHPYFSMPLTTDPSPEDFPGFAFTTDAVISDYFLTIPDTEIPIYSLNDQELRNLIKYLARRNSRLMSMKEVDDLCFEFFGDAVDVVDNGDMTLTFNHDLGDPSNLFSIIQQMGLLPHPAGVKVLVA